MQTFRGLKAHLAITVDQTYQTGHTTASLKQRISNSPELFLGCGCDAHAVQQQREPRNDRKGILIV